MRPATVLVLILLALPAAGAWGVASTATDDCRRYVPGVGMACPVDGGYVIDYPDGTRAFTHGPDPVPSGDLLPLAYAPSRDPACVHDTQDGAHGLVIFGYPALDRGAPSDEEVAALREMVRHANGLLYAEGKELGAGVDYRIACEPDGRIRVDVVAVPLPRGQGDFTTLTSILKALGYSDGNAKYWVFYDDRDACFCGGMGTAPLSPDPSPFNAANAGGMFGVTYGYWGDVGALILMHENGHNLGAVRNDVPDSSGAAHCNDGQDIMCYADGGPTSNYKWNVCTRMHFDCDHDSYFHTRPAPGSLLATTWNLGAPTNRFIEGCHYVEGRVLAPRAAPANVANVPIPAQCQGSPFALYGRATESTGVTTIQGPSVNVFTLCWFEGATPRGCHNDLRGWQNGIVPAGVDRAEVRWINGVDGTYTLSIV